MDAKLTIDEKLKDLRLERKLTLEELANETGLSSSALASYEADPYKDISVNAMVTLAKYYGVSTDYILGLTENREVSNVEVRDLYLSDEMIALLKEGRINNLLLCEMATHEEFKNLLADIEIYVDRIADMRAHDMNADMHNMGSERPRFEHNQKYRNQEKPRTLSYREQTFEIFWKAYPRHEEKSAARKAWMEMSVPTETLIAALENAKSSRDWLQDNGRYIPRAAKWLDGKWEDYIDQYEREERSAWTEY